MAYIVQILTIHFVYNHMMKLDQVEPDIQFSSQQQEKSSLLNNARSGFVQKVYSILSIQMLITVIGVTFTMTIPSYAAFQFQNIWLFYLSAVGSFATLIPLACCSGVSKKIPINYIMLFGFTICESYMVSMVCSLYTPQSVFLAAVATFAATLGLTTYAMYAKTDFTQCLHWMTAFFWSFLFITIVITVLNVFFIRSEFATVLISIAIASIYSIYLLIDTQLILGGRKAEITMDNYVLGAVLLYIDIIQLFIRILRILGKRNQ